MAEQTEFDIKAIIAERDRILVDMDQEAAKTFIKTHGGTLPRGRLNWERVLHLARFEATSIDRSLVTDSHIWLARNGATSISHGETSRESAVALELLFPRDTFDALMATQPTAGATS